MSAVKKKLHIAAPIEKVWTALTEPASIRGWMGDDSTIEVDLKVGGSFRLFGGDTTGQFTVIKKPGTLEYSWRQRAWPREWADSVVRWDLRSKGKGTDVQLTHDRFPNKDERDSHDEGWDSYWLGPMQEWLEASKS